MPDYASKTDDQLLRALERAGRVPEPALIEACLDRGRALVPGLLDRFALELDEPDWAGEDPRWYVAVHAGRLLIALGATAALPLFEQHYRRDEEQYFSDSIPSTDLLHLGPDVAPTLRAWHADHRFSPWTRWSFGDALSQAAHAHPELRTSVLEALHAALPPLDEAGRPQPPEDGHEDAYILWAATLLALAKLGDDTARSAARALHEADLVDEMIYGDFQEFERILASDAPRDRPQEIGDYDVVEIYRRWQESERRRAERERIRAAVKKNRIGRNQRVTLEHPDSGERVEGIKYKHAADRLEEGWEIVAIQE